jgi:hypothetical protein
MSPYITPPSKARCHDARGSPGGGQICSGERNRVKGGCVVMAGCAWVFAVELRDLRLCMQLCMLLPLVITLVVALPFDQILEAVVAHSAIQYSLDLVLLFASDESWGRG